MTRIYISADLEGVLGITSPHQCFPTRDKSGYQQAVQQLVLEMTTVTETLAGLNITDILINDSHAYMVNLSPTQLPATVQLLSGKPKSCAMSAGLDASFDAAFYLGYHAMAGTHNGVLCHTFHDHVFEVSVNGKPYGESGFNALYASLVHRVPVVLLSGDKATCSEIRSLLPEIYCVPTKTGLSFSSALSRPWLDVKQDYQQAVADSVQSHAIERARINRLKLPSPYTLDVVLLNTRDADVACTLPWLTRVDGRQVRFTSDSFETIYRTLQSIYVILSYMAYPG